MNKNLVMILILVAICCMPLIGIFISRTIHATSNEDDGIALFCFLCILGGVVALKYIMDSED